MTLQDLGMFWAQYAGPVVLALCVVWVLSRYIRARMNRPIIAKHDIVYRESFASGASYKNFLTRLGGANGCLRLVVTCDLLWVTAWFPFGIFAVIWDLEHVIRLRSIRAVKSRRGLWRDSILLSFEMLDGQIRTLKLMPKDPAAFLLALGAQGVRA